jgi:hypothetical protein
MTPSILPLKMPPLENGDQLPRYEFEQRYAAMPDVKKAELIEGCVYMASPLHAKAQGKPHAQIITWLGTYSALTPGVELLDNATVRLDSDNEVQPDAFLTGILCSAIFPGLWLTKSALLSGDIATVLTVLQQGLATPEHQSFNC